MIKENGFLVYAILVYTADGPNLVVVQRVMVLLLGDVLALNIVLIKHYIKLNHFFVYREPIVSWSISTSSSGRLNKLERTIMEHGYMGP